MPNDVLHFSAWNGQQPSVTHSVRSRASVDLPVSMDLTWAVASDLNGFGRWLTIHDCWHGHVPARPSNGVAIVEQIMVGGGTCNIAWTVKRCRAPRVLRLAGNGPDDMRAALEILVKPAGAWSRAVLDVEFCGWAMVGAAGIAMEMSATRELKASLSNLEHLLGIR